MSVHSLPPYAEETFGSGEESRLPLCKAGVLGALMKTPPPRRSGRTSEIIKPVEYTFHANDIQLRGPYGSTSEEYKDFVDTVIKTDNLNNDKITLPFMCSKVLSDYARSDDSSIQKMVDPPPDQGYSFGIYEATVPATTNGFRCLQPIGCIIFRELHPPSLGEFGDATTLYVHIELICRAKAVDMADGQKIQISGKQMWEGMQKGVLGDVSGWIKSVTGIKRKGDINRIQFSLDSIQDAIKAYEKWGFTSLRGINPTTPLLEHPVNKAFPMVKIFNKSKTTETWVAEKGDKEITYKLDPELEKKWKIVQKNIKKPAIWEKYKVPWEIDNSFYRVISSDGGDPRTPDNISAGLLAPTFPLNGFAGLKPNDPKDLANKFANKFFREGLNQTKAIDKAAKEVRMRTGLSELRQEVHEIEEEKKTKQDKGGLLRNLGLP